MPKAGYLQAVDTKWVCSYSFEGKTLYFRPIDDCDFVAYNRFETKGWVAVSKENSPLAWKWLKVRSNWTFLSVWIHILRHLPEGDSMPEWMWLDIGTVLQGHIRKM
jgi:hypothetical protein